jgi:hypothetical protein
LIVTAIEQRRLIEVFVAPVIVQDGDGATILKPLGVSDEILGRIPELHLPRAHRDLELTAMWDQLSALIRVGRVGRITHRPFQVQFQVEVGGSEVEIAKHFFFLVGILGVDVDPDFGLEVRWSFGSAPDERLVCFRTQMAPFGLIPTMTLLANSQYRSNTTYHGTQYGVLG